MRRFSSVRFVTFAKYIPQVMELYSENYINPWRVISSVLYGGVIEEVIVRLVLMSLLSMILYRLSSKHKTECGNPASIFIAANLISSVLFAVGHLSATAITFGELNFLIVLRCIVLNVPIGVLYGYLYRKYGIQYAMLAHGLTHIFYEGVLLLVV